MMELVFDGRGDAKVNIIIYIVFTELRMHSGSYKGSSLHRLRDLFLRALKLNLSPKIQYDSRTHFWWDLWQKSVKRYNAAWHFWYSWKIKILVSWNNCLLEDFNFDQYGLIGTWFTLLPGSTSKNKSCQTLDIRQIRWVVSGRRATKSAHQFPDPYCLEKLLRLQRRKGEPRGAQWVPLIECTELEVWDKQSNWRLWGRAPERREMHRRRALEVYGGCLLHLRWSIFSVNVMEKFSKPGEGTTNISKKKKKLVLTQG